MFLLNTVFKENNKTLKLFLNPVLKTEFFFYLMFLQNL